MSLTDLIAAVEAFKQADAEVARIQGVKDDLTGQILNLQSKLPGIDAQLQAARDTRTTARQTLKTAANSL